MIATAVICRPVMFCRFTQVRARKLAEAAAIVPVKHCILYHLLPVVLCRFTEVRARKLAEAAAIVNELLLKASTLVSSALASDSAQPKDVQEMLAQVRAGMRWVLFQMLKMCNGAFAHHSLILHSGRTCKRCWLRCVLACVGMRCVLVSDVCWCVCASQLHACVHLQGLRGCWIRSGCNGADNWHIRAGQHRHSIIHCRMMTLQDGCYRACVSA
jgi:hypothetical protein